MGLLVFVDERANATVQKELTENGNPTTFLCDCTDDDFDARDVSRPLSKRISA